MKSLIIVPLLAIAVSGCSVESTPSTTESAKPTKKAEVKVDTSDHESCKSLIPEVVRISAGHNDPGQTSVLEIYKPKKVFDRQTRFDQGKIKPAKGKNTVTVLRCTGQAADDEGSASAIRYELQIDTKGTSFVYYEAIE